VKTRFDDFLQKLNTVCALQTAAKNFNQGKEDFSSVVHGITFIIADICSVLHFNLSIQTGEGRGEGKGPIPPAHFDRLSAALPKPALSLSKGGKGAGRLMVVVNFQERLCSRRS